MSVCIEVDVMSMSVEASVRIQFYIDYRSPPLIKWLNENVGERGVK